MVSPVTATLGKFAVELPISLLVLNALSVRIMSATLTDYVCFIIFCCFDVCVLARNTTILDQISIGLHLLAHLFINIFLKLFCK